MAEIADRTMEKMNIQCEDLTPKIQINLRYTGPKIL